VLLNNELDRTLLQSTLELLCML